ncbi:MAG: hypothetical protein ABUS57_09280 [Pseudomonadota bacterium]
MNTERRALLVAGAAALLTTGNARAETSAKPIPPGNPGDFDWLTGEWRIAHRQRRATGEWIEFTGEATCWSVMGGVGHVEDLRIPARNFNGIGLRLLDRETRVWNDFWVNEQAGQLGEAGLTGGFIDGVGMFTADDTADGHPVKYAGIWDEITANTHRWRQGVSHDGGATWDYAWIMQWRRA